MTWDEAAIRWGADKASSHHDYMVHYERLLADRTPERLLEIGVDHGRSLGLWRELFPDTIVVGVDINPWCLIHQRDRSPVVWADASNTEQMWALTSIYGPFDIVIDDGSHQLEDVHKAFQELYLRMRTGGIYIVEDLDGADPQVQQFTERHDGEIVDVPGDRQGLQRPCLLVFHKDF